MFEVLFNIPEPVAQRISSISNYGAVIGATLGLFGLLGSLYGANVLANYAAVQRQADLKEIALARSAADVARAETAQTSLLATQSQERIAELEVQRAKDLKEIALARSEAEVAKAETAKTALLVAQSHERIAQVEAQRAKDLIEFGELVATLGPRYIDQSQTSELLSRFKDIRVALLVVSRDEECVHFAEQVRATLLAAQWELVPLEALQVSKMEFDRRPEGVAVYAGVGFREMDDQSRASADMLLDRFGKVGAQATFQTANLGKNSVVVSIGRVPPNFFEKLAAERFKDFKDKNGNLIYNTNFPIIKYDEEPFSKATDEDNPPDNDTSDDEPIEESTTDEPDQDVPMDEARNQP